MNAMLRKSDFIKLDSIADMYNERNEREEDRTRIEREKEAPDVFLF